MNEPLLVGDVLDVARNDFDAELRHVGLSFLHHLVRESVAVGIE